MRVTERPTAPRNSSILFAEKSEAKKGRDAAPAAWPMMAIGAVKSFFAFIRRVMSPVSCLAKNCRICVSMKTMVTPNIIGIDIFTQSRRPSLCRSSTGSQRTPARRAARAFTRNGPQTAPASAPHASDGIPSQCAPITPPKMIPAE